MMLAAIVILTAVISAGVCSYIAWTKGRPVGRFAAAGLLTGPVGIVYALLAFPSRDIELSEAEKDRRAERAARWQRLGWPS